MDKKYTSEHTRDWHLEDSDGEFELYLFFDMLEWKDRYAIKHNGKVVYDFDEGQHGGNYSFFEAVCKIDKMRHL